MDTTTLDSVRQSLSAALSGIAGLSPELVLAGIVLILILTTIWDSRTRILPWLAVFGLAMSGVLLIGLPAEHGLTWGGMIVFDRLGHWTRGLLLFGGVFIVLWVGRESNSTVFPPELYPLVLALLLGAMMMVLAVNLLMMYLSLELVSISSYLLTVHQRQARSASEGALKYILFGAFSSALMLYGISWWYGLTGSLSLHEAEAIARVAAFPSETQILTLGLILAGLLFKIAAVPMHFWAPDVYQGTSYPVAAFFSLAPKAGGLIMLIHLLHFTADLPIQGDVQLILLLVAIASMTLGNLAALWQRDLKRLLAYSSIAQSGFMLVAVACRSELGDTTALFYLTIYFLMNLLVFILAAGLAHSTGSDDIRQLDGLAARFPLSTIGMTIGLVALVGLPPTAGFIAKWYVIVASIGQVDGPHATMWIVALALVVVNTVISLFYYLRIPVRMTLRSPAPNQVVSMLPRWTWIGGILAGPVLILGFVGFDTLISWIQNGLWN